MKEEKTMQEQFQHTIEKRGAVFIADILEAMNQELHRERTQWRNMPKEKVLGQLPSLDLGGDRWKQLLRSEKEAILERYSNPAHLQVALEVVQNLWNALEKK